MQVEYVGDLEKDIKSLIRKLRFYIDAQNEALSDGNTWNETEKRIVVTRIREEKAFVVQLENILAIKERLSREP